VWLLYGGCSGAAGCRCGWSTGDALVQRGAGVATLASIVATPHRKPGGGCADVVALAVPIAANARTEQRQPVTIHLHHTATKRAAELPLSDATKTFYSLGTG
jgi:hypothetical protein